jgi:hypothetical protein
MNAFASAPIADDKPSYPVLIYLTGNEGLADEEGNLKAEFSMEGLHLWSVEYSIILENMKKYL